MQISAVFTTWVKEILSKILDALKNENPYKSDIITLNKLRKKYRC